MHISRSVLKLFKRIAREDNNTDRTQDEGKNIRSVLIRDHAFHCLCLALHTHS